MTAENKQCNICGCTEYKKRSGEVRDHKELQIYECTNCGLVFLSSFSHITDKYYAESNMHQGVIVPEQLLKQTFEDDDRRFRFLKDITKGKKVLDFGCGYGGFLKYTKEIADEVYGLEIEEAASEYCQKQGINIISLEDDYKFDVITMFHVIEHLLNPLDILQQLKEKLNEGGIIIIETPNSNDALLTLYESTAFSKFTYWGCHVYLYNEKNLIELGVQSGMKLKFAKQVQRYPLANHLYWLSQGKPGGHKIWQQINDEKLNQLYAEKLGELGTCDTIIIGLEK